jgi:neutral ceramidase
MRAGAGQVDITPALGTHLAGDGAGRHRPARSVRDPLYARALVVESGGRQICLLAMDLLCVTLESTTRIRSEAARRFGLKPDAILVHVEQNHSAPSLGALMLDPDFPFPAFPDKEYITGSESAYVEYAIGNALEAIGKACASLRPVHAGWGRGMIEGLAFNRRGIHADGTIGMPWFFSSDQQPLGPTHIRAMEGPFDPEVGVLCLSDENGQPAAMLMNYACHPVNVYATDLYAVSGDWPGAWASAMQKVIPGGCVPLVLNGCCGNLNPWPAFTPDFKPDSARMGEALAGMSRKVIERLNRSQTSVVDWRTRRLPLAYREVPEARRREADRILEEHPGIKWDTLRGEIDIPWFMAASTKSIDYCRKRWPVFSYEIQVFRIGDAAVVGLPGEPFVEGQIEIKLRSPAALVQVAHMCTQYVGYLPTREAAARGGHEASELCPYWAKLAPDSLERIVQEVKSMLAELFP